MHLKLVYQLSSLLSVLLTVDPDNVGCPYARGHATFYRRCGGMATWVIWRGGEHQPVLAFPALGICSVCHEWLCPNYCNHTQGCELLPRVVMWLLLVKVVVPCLPPRFLHNNYYLHLLLSSFPHMSCQHSILYADSELLLHTSKHCCVNGKF